MTNTIRPRRSALFMPASNARAVAKARTLPVDVVILDLEDAVAPDAKAAAREQAVMALREGFGPRETVVRINGIGALGHGADLAAVAAAALDAVLVPKISRADDVLQLARALDAAGSSARLWLMIESAAAVLNIREIAAACTETGRVAAFVMGPNDLARETRARLVPGRAPMLPWLMDCLAAARVAGVDILDGVYNDIADADGFARECEQGREMGFDGKTLIHPSQVAACNAAFSPSAEEVEDARRIVAAFVQPEAAGQGVVMMDGRMVERLHAQMAARVLALAEAIARREAETR
ncbi:MAG TPA: CoA ester lyase [Xanthobacteraceae bacterium]|nr:CoA ester lyase [Xanthobacteraceae bacterium]